MAGRDWARGAAWLLVLLVPVALAAYFLLAFQMKSARDRAQQYVAHAAHAAALLTDSTAGVERQRLVDAGQDASLGAVVERGDFERLRLALSFIEFDPSWSGVLVVSPTGRALASIGAVRQEEAALALGTEERVAILPSDAGRSPRLVVAAPVFHRGAVVAELVGLYQMRAVHQALMPQADGGGAVFLLDRESRIVGGPPERLGERIDLSGTTDGTTVLPGEERPVAMAVQPALDGALRLVAVRRPAALSSMLLPILLTFAAVAVLLAAFVFLSRLRLLWMEERMQRRERELKAVNELAIDATTHADRLRIIQIAGSRAAELVGGAAQSFVVLATSCQAVAVYRAFPRPDSAPERLEAAGDPTLARALNHGRRECGGVEARSPEWRRVLDGGGANWECWTPLVAHGQVLGALGLVWPQPRALGPEESTLLDALAATLAVALESGERLTRLKNQEAMLSTVIDASPDAIAALSADNRIRLDNPALRRIFSASRSLVGESLFDAVAAFERGGGRVELDFDPEQYIGRAREGDATRGTCRIGLGSDVRQLESLMVPLPLPTGEAGVLLALRDVTERAELDQVRRLNRRVQALAREAASRAALLDLVLASSDVGLLFVDRDGRVAYANHLVGELLAVPSPTRGLDFEALRALIAGRAAEPVDELLEKGGVLETTGPARRVLAVRSVEVRGDDGQVIGRLLSLRDETARRELEDARDAFIGLAAHELKNPVAALRLQAEAALRVDDSRRPEAVRRINARTVDLQRLVERLLDMARVDLGQLKLERSAVDLSSIAADAADAVRAQGVEVSVQAEPDVLAWADPVRAQQVVGNLLSNAVRYGGGRPVSVFLRRDGDEVRLSVTDQGPGIPEGERERIFSRFGQGRAGRKGPGLGIGLYLSRRIAEAHGGRIELETTLGKGSTFTFVVPAALSAVAQAGQWEGDEDELLSREQRPPPEPAST